MWSTAGPNDETSCNRSKTRKNTFDMSTRCILAFYGSQVRRTSETCPIIPGFERESSKSICRNWASSGTIDIFRLECTANGQVLVENATPGMNIVAYIHIQHIIKRNNLNGHQFKWRKRDRRRWHAQDYLLQWIFSHSFILSSPKQVKGTYYRWL